MFAVSGEREANYWTKLGIKLPSCPYEGTVPLEQGLGLIRRVVERKGVSSPSFLDKEGF